MSEIADDDFFDPETASLLLTASQLLDLPQPLTLVTSGRRFRIPRTSSEIFRVEKSRVPKKAKANTSCAITSIHRSLSVTTSLLV